MKIIIYMPAYNEEKDIQRVISSLPKSLKEIDVLEYLVVDDGSIDDTASLARLSGAQVVTHGKNRGVGAAFQSAVQFALDHNANILVSIDSDGQFDPVEIPELIDAIISGKADMVIGNRFLLGMPKNMPFVRYWGNRRVAQIVSSITKQEFHDVSCGFRAYSREALLHLNIFSEFTYTHETILSLVYQGLLVMEHPVSVTYDPDRKSRVASSVIYYTIQTSKIILRVLLDYRPVRVFGAIGFLSVMIGMIFIVLLLLHYFLFHSFTPYKTLGFTGLGFIIFGMLILIIALVSDMLNRIRVNQDKILYELRKDKYKI